jgi:S-formylglutathione hydrolase FrmB
VAANRAHNPLEVMAPTTMAGWWFAAGTGDQVHLKVAARLAAEARAAGIKTHTLFGAGGHSWTFAGHAFALIYPALVHDVFGSTRLARTTSVSARPTWRSPLHPGA